MGSKNKFAAWQKAKRQAEYKVVAQWSSQAWADAFVIVTGQPEVMGKDTFGPERAEKVLRAIEEKANYIHRAVHNNDDAEAIMEQTERALQQRLGDKFTPATERYTGWTWKDDFRRK